MDKRFKFFTLRILISILDRLMFPKLLSIERDREHQILLSNAADFCKYMLEENENG